MKNSLLEHIEGSNQKTQLVSYIFLDSEQLLTYAFPPKNKATVVVRPAFWRLFYHILTTLSNGPIGHSTRKVLMLAKRPQLPALEHDKHI